MTFIRICAAGDIVGVSKSLLMQTFDASLPFCLAVGGHTIFSPTFPHSWCVRWRSLVAIDDAHVVCVFVCGYVGVVCARGYGRERMDDLRGYGALHNNTICHIHVLYSCREHIT